MDRTFAYLLWLIIGNGTIQRMKDSTTIVIELPHKNFKVDEKDVKLYVAASLNDIRNYLEPLLGVITTNQNDSVTRISFTQSNDSDIIQKLNVFLEWVSNHENMRIHQEVFDQPKDVRIAVLQWIADSTWYVRRSNYYFTKYKHRVYIEIPHNWYLVVDICNLLKSVDIPVQTIDYAHPNLRDGDCVKYNKGQINFWKKEHQIKIFVNEFLPIWFLVKHKQEALLQFTEEFMIGMGKSNLDELKKYTHHYYREKLSKPKMRKVHPRVIDNFIPEIIRGRQMNWWQEISEILWYKQ